MSARTKVAELADKAVRAPVMRRTPNREAALPVNGTKWLHWRSTSEAKIAAEQRQIIAQGASRGDSIPTREAPVGATEMVELSQFSPFPPVSD